VIPPLQEQLRGSSWNASAERKRPGIDARKEEERINAIKPLNEKNLPT